MQLHQRVQIINFFWLCLFVFFLILGCSSKHIEQKTPSSALSLRAKQIYLFLTFTEQKKQDPQAALSTLNELLTLRPAPILYQEKAYLIWQEKKPAAVREVLKAGVTNFPDDRSLNLALARYYTLENRLEDARTCLLSYLRHAPDDFTARDELASAFLGEKAYAPAADLLTTVLSEQHDSHSWMLLGQAYAGLNKDTLAEKYLKKATEYDPKNMKAWTELAFFYESQKEYAEAEKIYSHLVDDNEENNEFLSRLINLNLKLNDPDRAFSFVTMLKKEENTLAQAALLFIDYEFLEYAREVMKMLPQDFIQGPGLYVLGLLAANLEKNSDKAFTYLKQIRPNNKYFAASLLLQLRMLVRDGKFQEAATLCEQGKKFFPENPSFPLMQANMYSAIQKNDNALTVLLEAEKKWPDNADVLFSLGSLLYNRQEPQKALAYMEKIIQIDPSHASALNFLGYTLAEKNQDLARALALIQRALNKEPGNGYFLDSLAWVYFKMGKTQNAWKIIQQSVLQVNDEQEIWEHYAIIAEALGLKKEQATARKKIKFLKKQTTQK